MKKGITLILLIITIIIIIILAGTIILSLSKNNPINSANEAVFKNNANKYESELTLFLSEQIAKTLGNYDKTKLYADKESVKYDGVVIPGKTIDDIVPSIKNSSDHSDYKVTGENLFMKEKILQNRNGLKLL